MRSGVISIFLLLTCLVSSAQDYYVIKESFEHNSNEWKEVRLTNIHMDVTEGVYFIKNMSSRPIIIDRALSVDQSKDFTITAEVKIEKGSRGDYVGLTWGKKDFDNYYFFGIDNKNKFSIVGVEAGENRAIKNWTASDAILPIEQQNTLQIKRKGSKISWLVNGTVVHHQVFKPFNRGKFGFLADRGMLLAIDSYEIVQPVGKVNINPLLVYETPKEHIAVAGSAYPEQMPVVSPDGLTLYFSREDNPESMGKMGRKDIWRVVRANAESPWGNPEMLPDAEAANDPEPL